MTYRERRTILIFWTFVILYLLGAFAAEAAIKNRVCVSAMTVDASGTTVYPEVCS